MLRTPSIPKQQKNLKGRRGGKRISKSRVSRHNGRVGKKGQFNPKHNDRSFDLDHADHIRQEQTSLNLYWDCRNGLRTHDENARGDYPSFEVHEKAEYAQRYGSYLEGQALRNKKSGHSNRDRTADDLYHDKRYCPEETIYQFGKMGESPPSEVVTAIVTDFMQRMEERYGAHVHVLDWALHMDETTPHIHARQVFDYTNRYGEVEPKQNKALEAMNIPLPHPEQPTGKLNNRKITFDQQCRELLLGVCAEHGLAVETEPIYGGKAHLEKNEFIIQDQLESMTSNQQVLATQQQQIVDAAKQLNHTKEELAKKAMLLEDENHLLDQLSAMAYDAAATTVAALVVQETQKADWAEINQVMKEIASPQNRMKPKEKELVVGWLSKARDGIKAKAQQVLAGIKGLLNSHEARRAATDRIKDQLRPSLRNMLTAFAEKAGRREHPSARQRRDLQDR